jgi:hypothetical protein
MVVRVLSDTFLFTLTSLASDSSVSTGVERVLSSIERFSKAVLEIDERLLGRGFVVRESE